MAASFIGGGNRIGAPGKNHRPTSKQMFSLMLYPVHLTISGIRAHNLDFIATVKPVLRGHLCTVKPVLRGHLCTVKPVLRGHLWDKQKVAFQDR